MWQLHRSVTLPCRQVRSRLTRSNTRTSEKLDKPHVPARSQAARCASIALYAAYWCVPFMRGLLLGPRFGSDRPLQGGNSRITDVGSGSLWKALHSDPERSFEACQSGHSLYMFFSMAPAILMTGFGFPPLGLSVFFASTVFVVFAAGFLDPRLARRWGQIPVARGGLWVALGGGAALLVGPPEVVYFSVAMTVFLLGMGLINPLGTAITLQPFGHQAGAATALLGSLQMMCAAAAIGLAALLPLPVYGAFCTVLTANLVVALLSFRGAARGSQVRNSERSRTGRAIQRQRRHRARREL